MVDYVDDFAVTSGDVKDDAPFEEALAEHTSTVRSFLERCREHKVY